MDPSFVGLFLQEALFVFLKVALPPIITALVIGIIMSLLQVLTQVQEQSVTFVPKLLAVGFCLFLMFAHIRLIFMNFSDDIFKIMSQYL